MRLLHGDIEFDFSVKGTLICKYKSHYSLIYIITFL